jgi:hypothetical protein
MKGTEVDHGHALLMAELAVRPQPKSSRPRLLEVGTTREPHPGQDSTRSLAQWCLDHRWDFVTCDMDPQNTERARELFGAMGATFVAVNAKGEDFIAAHHRAFDAVYLDAYDFDHGKHSETRQERYETFLGSRIDQRACELMHLEAMRGLRRAARSGCIVVIDDTWRSLDGIEWLGKGPLAVPWAIDHGWDLITEDADRRAVTLRRSGWMRRMQCRLSVDDRSLAPVNDLDPLQP